MTVQLKKDKKYLCKKCDKEVRVKSVTIELSDIGLCPQCYTKMS